MGPDASSPRLLCVAMFHQLHCVEKMRIFLDNPNDTHVGFGHQQHCMNYLRQTVLCKPSLLLEETINTNARVSHAGYDVVCRDWEAIYGEAERNYDMYMSRSELQST